MGEPPAMRTPSFRCLGDTLLSNRGPSYHRWKGLFLIDENTLFSAMRRPSCPLWEDLLLFEKNPFFSLTRRLSALRWSSMRKRPSGFLSDSGLLRNYSRPSLWQISVLFQNIIWSLKGEPTRLNEKLFVFYPFCLSLRNSSGSHASYEKNYCLLWECCLLINELLCKPKILVFLKKS